MSKTQAKTSQTPPTPKATGKVFTGVKRPTVTVLKPGAVDPTETLRRLRGR